MNGQNQDPDPTAVLLHYALHRLRKLPHEILELPLSERAFIYASISLYSKKEADAAKTK
ncbi:hypothetical protein PAECIP111891_02187 [Paenibacillus allorhizoplanae]|uniref:Uncharacterized protein n=1 Tax=Paenibacillus allorhizoplanae TaxID=2905648 RepID=A0ABN8G8T3_9BACL|nr:hypothetical protein PAECIP111891_02187 [Paenibacillus allorhizoplanae]